MNIQVRLSLDFQEILISFFLQASIEYRPSDLFNETHNINDDLGFGYSACDVTLSYPHARIQ